MSIEYKFTGVPASPKTGTAISPMTPNTFTVNFGSVNSGMPYHYELKIKKLHEDAILPSKAHSGDLGFDLYALEDVILTPSEVTKVRTGIAARFPKGCGALIRDRSSVATKAQVFVVAGVIDEGYTGELIVAFYNPGKPHLDVRREIGTGNVCDVNLNFTSVKFSKGDKIAQLIITNVHNPLLIEVENLGETTRGENGFGSSGK